MISKKFKAWIFKYFKEEIMAAYGHSFNPSRIKQFKETNGKASSFIFDMEIEKEIELINQ